MAWNAGFSRHPLRESAAERDTLNQPRSRNISERRLPAGIDRREAVEMHYATYRWPSFVCRLAAQS